MCALQWSDIDFSGGTVHIQRTAYRINYGGRTELVIQAPKSECSDRVIPLTAKMHSLLRPLKTSGYATADITAYWRLGKQVTLHLAIHNMFNRSYYDWSTVSHLTGNDPRLAAYSAPGRTAAMSLRLDF